MYKRRSNIRRPKPRKLFQKRATQTQTPTDAEGNEGITGLERNEREHGLGFLDTFVRWSLILTFLGLLLVNHDRTPLTNVGGSAVRTKSVGRKDHEAFQNGVVGDNANVDENSSSDADETSLNRDSDNAGGGLWRSIGSALVGYTTNNHPNPSELDDDGEHDDDNNDYDTPVLDDIHDDYDDHNNRMRLDLLESNIRSRIIDEFGRLFDSDTSRISTGDMDSTQIYDRLWSVYDRDGSYYELLGDVDTPQGRAFQYVIKELSSTSLSSSFFDPTVDPEGGVTLVQRYVLAVLYFSTLGTTPTTTTTTTHTEPNTDTEESVQWTRQSDDTSWTRYGSLSFLTPTLHECQWYDTRRGTHYGIKCCEHVDAVTSAFTKLKGTILGPSLSQSNNECHDDTIGTVTNLFLPSVGLRGTLPEEIGFLTGLEVLDLQNNELEGMVPQSLGLLTNLRYLGLGGNRFTGIVPDTVSSLTSLETLYLNFNQMDGGNYLSTSICPLKQPVETHRLYSIWADCGREQDPISCDCCDVCCDETRKCQPVQAEGRRDDPRNDDDEGDDDDDDDDREDNAPIRSRSKRLTQRKETREHKSQGLFGGWIR